jgi:hypothetical protein
MIHESWATTGPDLCFEERNVIEKAEKAQICQDNLNRIEFQS